MKLERPPFFLLLFNAYFYEITYIAKPIMKMKFNHNFFFNFTWTMLLAGDYPGRYVLKQSQYDAVSVTVIGLVLTCL